MNLEAFFPYDEFRTGQRELATSVYSACVRGDRLVAEAMSGFGKTAAVLAGALSAAAENNLKIVYLCRTKRQVARVTEEIAGIQSKTAVRSAHLFSKFDYCLLKETHPYITSESFKWFCSFYVSNNLCSYFLNVSLLPNEMVNLANTGGNSLLSHRDLLEKSRQLHVCPYEVTRLSIPDARVMTATYHYLFDEASKLVLFANTQLDRHNTILVLDEAHNVRDFIRGITTFELSFEELERAVRDSQSQLFGRASTSLHSLSERIREFCSHDDGWHVDKSVFLSYVKDGHDGVWLSNLALELTACARTSWYSISNRISPPLSLMQVGRFLTNLLASIEDESKILAKSDSGLIMVNADPGRTFAASTKDFRSVVMLSATVNPTETFLKSLGLQPASVAVHTASPIESLKILTLLDCGVTTKFRARTDEMYEKIADRITGAISSSRGGVGVFTPSYIVLDVLKSLIEKKLPDKRILVESRGITNEMSAEMMLEFKSSPRSVLLAVQGGRFSEGEDFRDEAMSLSIVVGLALAPPSPLMYAEYSFLGRVDPKSSYLTVSLLPALRKAFQSAGRHIRSPNKRGIVLLLDSRFNNERIIRMMPGWMKRDLHVGDFPAEKVSKTVRDFEAATNQGS